MKIISHRGNIDGPTNLENNPNQILKAIDLGLDIEIDIWGIDGKIWSGHDKPEYEISQYFMLQIQPYAWVHCKNLGAITIMQELYALHNFFWHESDQYTITSLGYIWAYPGADLNEFSINVLPEKSGAWDNQSYGICTDYPIKYLNSGKCA